MAPSSLLSGDALGVQAGWVGDAPVLGAGHTAPGEDLFLLEDHLWHELGLAGCMHEHLGIKAELREPSPGVKDHLRKSKNLRFVYKMTL